MIANTDPDFSVAYIKTDKYEIEIDEDGSITLEGDCTCGHWCKILLSLDELTEIARQAVAFRAARIDRTSAQLHR